MKKSSLIALCTVAILLLGGLIIWQVLKPTDNVSLVVSPSVAKLTLDGSTTVHPGNFHVLPGNHKIQAVMDGFTSKTVTFTVQKSRVTKVSIMLIPNSSVGTNWLINHPEESANRESIGNHDYDQQNQQATSNAPLIKELPYIGAGFEFRIDYGSNQSNPTKPTIIITGATPQAQQDAITWIQGQGFNPSDYTIQYVTAQP